MRKILFDEFNSDIHILKVGFDDYPPCPYGHNFKMLGYDTSTNEYIRLHSKILKEESLKRIYKEEK